LKSFGIKIFFGCWALFVLICVFLHSFPVQAQLESILNGYEDKYYNHDEGPGATHTSEDGRSGSKYIYETPTVAALSHLFWAVNLYKTSNDWAVDEFLKLNECELYQVYGADDFEWKSIRDASRAFIRQNHKDFPTRFAFIIPLKLGDYIEEEGAFEVQEDFEIVSLRRFEVFAKDYRKKGCTYEYNPLSGFPRALVLEFSRPFTLVSVPVSKKVATDYIRRKSRLLRKYHDGRSMTKSVVFDARDAYLLLKVKVFTHGKFLGPGGEFALWTELYNFKF